MKMDSSAGSMNESFFLTALAVIFELAQKEGKERRKKTRRQTGTIENCKLKSLPSLFELLSVDLFHPCTDRTKVILSVLSVHKNEPCSELCDVPFAPQAKESEDVPPYEFICMTELQVFLQVQTIV